MMAMEAVAQVAAQRQEKPPQWEYKVMTLAHTDTEATIQMNQLAADRREYVGRVSTTRGGGVGGPHDTANLFRRPKK